MKFFYSLPSVRTVILAAGATLLLPDCANAPAQSPASQQEFAGGNISPTSQSPDSQSLNPQLLQFLTNFDQYFAGEMTLTQTPGAAVVIVKDTQIVFMRGYGVRSAGGLDPVDQNTLFRIGSLSKGFAGVLTGILVQDKVLDWDEKVQKHFPEFTLRDEKQAERICLRHLLSHTTGLPYHAYTNLIEGGFDIRKIVTEYFPKAPVSGREGEFFSYQNAAFCAIEEVMRGATGKTYGQLLTEKILRPADMMSASCDYENIIKNPNRALPHFQTRRSGWQTGTISKEYYNSKAAGGVNASIADMGQWLKVLLGHRPDIVSNTTLDKVFSPVIKTDKERRIFPRWLSRDAASYALGWRVLNDGADTIIYHGGYVNGYKSEIAFNRRDGIGVCMLFNAHTELSKTCIPAFFERWKKR